MSATIKYKGETIATASNNTKTLLTAGKYMEANVVVTDTGGGGGATLQTKSVSYTPSETAISDAVLPDAGYDGLDRVNVSVGAISSTYVGSEVPRNDSTDVYRQSHFVGIPEGYYADDVIYEFPLASTPTIDTSRVDSTGKVTVDVEINNGGYIGAGTYQATDSVALPIQAAQTITPGTTDQTIASGKWLTGTQTILGDADLVAANIKKDVVIFGVVGSLETDGGGLTQEVKDALLQWCSKTVFVDDQGAQYYQDLWDALYPISDVSSISAVYTQSGTVLTTDSLDSLKADLVVTATYDDSTTATVPAASYTLSGSLTEGTSVITATYGGKTATFNVTVTGAGGRLPSGYTEYDYIEKSTASASGIVANAPMSSDYFYETKFKYSSSDSHPSNVIGTRNGTGGTKWFGIFATPSSGKIGYWFGGSDTTNTINALSNNTLNTVVIKPVGKSSSYPNNAVLEVNGTEYDSGATASGQTWGSYLGIFRYAATSSSTHGTNYAIGLQIGEILIKDGGETIIADFVPCHNGTYYGFYDTVAQAFYYDTVDTTSYSGGNWS